MLGAGEALGRRGAESIVGRGHGHYIMKGPPRASAVRHGIRRTARDGAAMSGGVADEATAGPELDVAYGHAGERVTQGIVRPQRSGK